MNKFIFLIIKDILNFIITIIFSIPGTILYIYFYKYINQEISGSVILFTILTEILFNLIHYIVNEPSKFNVRCSYLIGVYKLIKIGIKELYSIIKNYLNKRYKEATEIKLEDIPPLVEIEPVKGEYIDVTYDNERLPDWR